MTKLTLWVVDCIDDGYEMFKEFGGHIFVCVIMHGQIQRHVQHGQTKEAHPCSAVSLNQTWERCQSKSNEERQSA